MAKKNRDDTDETRVEISIPLRPEELDELYTQAPVPVEIVQFSITNHANHGQLIVSTTQGVYVVEPLQTMTPRIARGEIGKIELK